MPVKSNRVNLFFAELKRRKVTRLATVYAVVGLGIVEATDIIGGRFLFPEWTIKLLIGFVLAGFPVALILAWIFDISFKGIEKTEALSDEQQSQIPPLSWKPSWISVILFILLIAMTVTFCATPRPNAVGFKKNDMVMICDLENNTGEEIFDKSLSHALSLTIDQSKRIAVFPDEQVSKVLKRMRMDTVKKITVPIALEIAERENIKAVLVPSVSKLGESYIIGIKLLNSFTGESIRTRETIANNRDKVLEGLQKVSGRIRKDLGESLNDIHIYSLPLPQATTSSLEALKYLVKASSAWADDGKLDEAKTLYYEALKLDPDFALAHASLGFLYYWQNNRIKGEEHFTKTMELLKRLTKNEKLWIEARMEMARGNYDKAIMHFNVLLKNYPNSSQGWFGLGYSNMRLNNCEKAIDAFTKSLAVYNYKDPNTYINLASCYSMLNDNDRSINYYDKAFEINPSLLTIPNINHEYGFTLISAGKIDKAFTIFGKMNEVDDYRKAMGFRSQALAHMYSGNYDDAVDLLNESSLVMNNIGYALSELRNRLYLADAYAAKGMKAEENKELLKAMDIALRKGIDPWWQMILGKKFTRKGQVDKAEQLLDSLSGSLIEGILSDNVCYNILKGEIELSKGNSGQALQHFKKTVSLRKDVFTLESLANYFTVTGLADSSISRYAEIIRDPNSPGWEGQEYWINAHYNIGRLYEDQGQLDKAIISYRDYLRILHKGGDHLPLYSDSKERIKRLETLSSL